MLPNASQKICITAAFAVYGMCSGERFPVASGRACALSAFAPLISRFWNQRFLLPIFLHLIPQGGRGPLQRERPPANRRDRRGWICIFWSDAP